MTPADEVLLSPDQLSMNYRPLRRGEIIHVGDLFQEPHQTRRMSAEGLKYRFLQVVPDTFVNGVEIAGIAWEPSYPLVVRERPKPELFALAGDQAPTIFCNASKDMIRGELIAIRLGSGGTLASDKIDFSSFNASQTRSVAPMSATPREPDSQPADSSRI